MTVEYVDETANATVSVEFGVSDVGETIVDPPDWYAVHPDRPNPTDADVGNESMLIDDPDSAGNGADHE